MNKIKMGYCQECIFDKHETIECAAKQLKWALEDLTITLPFMDKIIKYHSYCEHFEPLEGWITMTEQQYPIHLRKIGEHQIAEFLEELMIEIDTHEEMFLELCQVKRERDALAADTEAHVVRCKDCDSYGQSPFGHPTIGWCKMFTSHFAPDFYCALAKCRKAKEVKVNGFD